MGSVSKKDFADLADVSKAAISKAVRENRIPVLPDGTIDVDAPESIAYIAAKKDRSKSKSSTPKKPTAKSGPKKKSAPRGRPKTERPPLSSPDEEEISSAMNKLALERRKLAAQAQQIELKNAQIEGKLVSHELMILAVWNPLETFFVRILTDGAKTMSSTFFNIVKSNGTREEVEIAIQQELSTFILPLKKTIIEALKIDE